MKIDRVTSCFASLILAMSLIAAPLAANADYATCKRACTDDGYSDSDCAKACSE